MNRDENKFKLDGWISVNCQLDSGLLNQAVEEILVKRLNAKLEGPQFIEFGDFGLNLLRLVRHVLNPEGALITKLQELFPESYLFPDFVVQVGQTPPKLLRPHQDLQSFLRHGLRKEIVTAGYVKVGVYLRGSYSGDEGVIHAVPGSHRDWLFGAAFSLPLGASRVTDWLRHRYKDRQVPLHAPHGSALIFDGRLLHSSSPVVDPDTYRDFKKLKITLYFSVVSKNTLRSYMITELNKYVEERFSPMSTPSQRLGYFSSDPYSVLDLSEFYDSISSGDKLSFFSFRTPKKPMED